MLASYDKPPVNTPDSDVDEFLNTARKRFGLCAEAERTLRQEAQKDLEFRTGNQWDPQAKEIRDNNNRPCLTINRIPQFIHQVSNELRKNSPSLSVVPVGDGADRDAADIWQGLIRHIEVASDAQVAYQTAFDNAVGNSFGWWRILTQRAGLDTFDKDIVIKPIRDPFSVYTDPAAMEADRSDMNFAFIRTMVSREEFKRLYPKTKMSEFHFFDQNVADFPGRDWLDAENVQIAEYFLREFKKRTLQLLVAQQESLPALREIFGDYRQAQATKDGLVAFTVFADEYKGIGLPGGVGIQKEEEVDFPKVKWYKITASDVLENTDWPGMYIPLIPVFGEEAVVNGQLKLFSLTRFIRDSQALYNYFRSQQAEIIALTPRAPFVGPVGAFKTHQKMWQTANNQNFPYLEYDLVVGANGQLAPPPQRNVAEPPIAAVNQATLQANEDLKAGTGIYDPSLGNKSNETSGRAIIARQQESDTANFHFIQNFRRSMRHQGKILLDLIPHIYDRADRIVRIVKPDNEHEMVMINGDTEYHGKPAFFDPSVGKYDIVTDIQPSYLTKQAQIFEMLSKFVETNPALWNVVGDLIMKSAPFPGNMGLEAANRMKSVLAPGVQQSLGANKDLPPEVQQQVAQLQMVIQQLSQQNAKLSDIIRTKQIEGANRERIATMQEQTKIIIEEMRTKAANADRIAEYDLTTLEHHLSTLDSMLQSLVAPPQQPSSPGQPTQ